MSYLNSLPLEIIENICSSLQRADIIALRQTNRRLSLFTREAFNDSFHSIAVTCSKAGMVRLRKFLSPNSEQNALSRRITDITIHTFTGHGLKELATELYEPSSGQAYAYIEAYSYVRKTIVYAISAMPNVQTITLSQLLLNGIEDPIVDWNGTAQFDPLYAMYVAPASSPPKVHALESGLGVFDELTTNPLRPRTLSLNLIIDPSHPPMTWDWVLFQPFRSSLVQQVAQKSPSIFKALFGPTGIDFRPATVLSSDTKHLKIIGKQLAVGYGGFRGIAHAYMQGLDEVVFMSIHNTDLVQISMGLRLLSSIPNAKTKVKFVDIHFSDASLFFDKYRLKVLEFRRCVAPESMWIGMFESIARWPTIERITFVDCKIKGKWAEESIPDKDLKGTANITAWLRNLVADMEEL